MNPNNLKPAWPQRAIPLSIPFQKEEEEPFVARQNRAGEHQKKEKKIASIFLFLVDRNAETIHLGEIAFFLLF